ncbi:bacteriocin [Vibrio mediterranei]|uniref:bacteriocin n=1 Tax=Vibrio mediterranei TaxID=689 RepID=UPI002284277B|nr:bacteriocin [Vibrio mediterranei]MCY9855123.1 bacteriocin [Vibrio mediterranei]
MKKFSCTRVKTLTDDELDQVSGGSWGAFASAVCRAFSPSTSGRGCDGCGSAAGDLNSAMNSGYSNSYTGRTYSGGCGAGAASAAGR